MISKQTGLADEVFRNRIRSARKTARQVRRLIAHQKAAGKQTYRKLVKITKQTVKQAKHVQETLAELNDDPAQGLRDTLGTFIPRAEQVIDQTIRGCSRTKRCQQKTSLFRSSSLIPPSSGEAKLVNQLSMAAHQQIFGKPPTQASADRDVFSADHEAEAKRRKIKRVVLPKPGKKSVKRRQHEKQPWFRRARKWHAGVEGRISVLKRCFDLDRCLNHGEAGFQRWVCWRNHPQSQQNWLNCGCKIRINW